jgi:hypothetical protein
LYNLLWSPFNLEISGTYANYNIITKKNITTIYIVKSDSISFSFETFVSKHVSYANLGNLPISLKLATAEYVTVLFLVLVSLIL